MKLILVLVPVLLLSTISGCVTQRSQVDIDQSIAITQLAIDTAENALHIYMLYQDVKEEEIQRRLDHIRILRGYLQDLLKKGTGEENPLSLN